LAMIFVEKLRGKLRAMSRNQQDISDSAEWQLREELTGHPLPISDC